MKPTMFLTWRRNNNWPHFQTNRFREFSTIIFEAFGEESEKSGNARVMYSLFGYDGQVNQSKH
jgi:hypothetical protein